MARGVKRLKLALRILAVVALAGVLVHQGVLAGRDRARPAAPSRLALAPCQLSSPSSAERLAARCGTFEVPEDHARTGGRTLQLRVAVVPAEATPREPDPVFYLAGGPGQAATEIYAAIAPALARVNRHRDVVLVDQRGTGSSGRLGCALLEDPSEVDRSDEEADRLLEACGQTLSERADLAQYGSEAHARDLDLVREAVGAEQLDLVGQSYGTRAALVYARLFPQRVRAMVLDGVAPMAMEVGAWFERDAARALALGFARCTADPACQAAFPDPAVDLEVLLTRLDARKVEVRFRDPHSGAPRRYTMGGDQVRQLVLFLAYEPETVSLIPALVKEGLAGDLSPLAALGAAAGRSVQSGISRPLQLAVLCAEDEPFFPAAPPPPGPFGEVIRRSFREACAHFPHGGVPAAFREPVRSEAPTLLLSGEADPVTPPLWAEAAARTLPRARSLTLAGQGHGVLSRGCVPRLVADFVDQADAARLDASCLARVQPQPFFLDLAGPSP
jgi:pimeloyl-ACP methyl ester carboxylesterase